MARLVYVGDAPGAAAFRLAGLDTRVPDPGDEVASIESALDGSELLLVSARVAAALPDARRDALEAALAPLFVVVPDTDDDVLPNDRLGGVFAQLGVET